MAIVGLMIVVNPPPAQLMVDPELLKLFASCNFPSTYAFVVRSVVPEGVRPRTMANAESAALRASIAPALFFQFGPPLPSWQSVSIVPRRLDVPNHDLGGASDRRASNCRERHGRPRPGDLFPHFVGPGGLRVVVRRRLKLGRGPGV